MKFAIVTDFHIGDALPYKGIYRKATHHAERLAERFVRGMNNSFRPDFVVFCGDMIEGNNAAADKRDYERGYAILLQLKCPVYYIVGDHELKYLNIGYFKKVLRCSQLYSSVDYGNFRFIFLFTKRLHLSRKIELGPSQLKWLKRQLETDRNIIIFSHHSLVRVNTRGNFWFGENPGITFTKDWQRFLEIIAGANVKLVFNGHLHWNKKVVVKDVSYITVQSLVENTSGKPKGPPANAFACVHLTDNFAQIRIKGEGGRNYRIKI